MKTKEKTIDRIGAVLFGMTKKEIDYIFDSYFACHRSCSSAIIESIEAIQEKNRIDCNVEYQVYVSEVLSTLGMLDAAEEDFRNYRWSDEKSELEKALKLHAHFVKIIDKVDKKGVHDFIIEAMYVHKLVKTESAVEDAMRAFACVFSLYLSYMQNCYCAYDPEFHKKK